MISLTSPTKTVWHAVRAGVKLLFLCGFTLALFVAPNLWWLVGALLFTIATYLVGSMEFARSGLRHLRALLPFFLIVGLWHAWTGTWEEGARIGLRLISAIGMANLVTMTSRLDEMIAVLTWLLTPIRAVGISTRPLELAIAMVIRFTPELLKKAGMLMQSWRARSPRRAGWRVIAPLAIIAIDDADHVAEALRARGGINPNQTS